MPSQPEESNGLLAVAQLRAVTGNKEANLRQMEQVIEGLPPAANRLVVFPELANTGYWFGDADSLRVLAEPVPDGPTVRRWHTLARAYGVHLVAGLPERDGDRIYNTAVVVGPEGVVAKYRKMHLWSEEKALYAPGDLGIVVVDLPFCRLGVMICYDTWFPEQARIMRLLGADVLAIPAALVWNDTPAHVKRGCYMVNYVGMATAHLNQVHLAMAGQVGHFAGKWLFGSSMIVEPNGWLLTDPAGDEEPATLTAEIDFTYGRQVRSWGAHDHFDHDRRTDVYGEYLGYAAPC